LVDEKEISSRIPVRDKWEPVDGTFGRSEFTFDAENTCLCPPPPCLHQWPP
jgi:hypothetical protein